MVLITDYKKPDGSIDWQAYCQAEKAERAARVNAGEICYDCGKWIFPKKGYQSLCFDCRQLANDRGEVAHDSRVRCSHCGHTSNASDWEGDLYGEGEHDIYCSLCGKEFTVSVAISFSYTSPARIDEPEEEGDGKEEDDGEDE